MLKQIFQVMRFVNIFSDDKLLRSTMRSICIVDGDKRAQHKLENYTIALPGDKSPEELVLNMQMNYI